MPLLCFCPTEAVHTQKLKSQYLYSILFYSIDALQCQHWRSTTTFAAYDSNTFSLIHSMRHEIFQLSTPWLHFRWFSPKFQCYLLCQEFISATRCTLQCLWALLVVLFNRNLILLCIMLFMAKCLFGSFGGPNMQSVNNNCKFISISMCIWLCIYVT